MARDPGGRARADVGVVAHTHWDREWYLTAEQFRSRLVDVFDGVLDTLESDAHFTAFLCDGQTAMVDDYLGARPESQPRIRSLAAGGRLMLGPWEILADSFLVSGETLVRNLARGMRRAGELGDVLRVGYLPDQFGQAAQLPQIFGLAGIRHCLVYRGVPDEVTTTAFSWHAPDGSCVRAEYLRDGYTNAIRLGDDEKELVARAHDYIAGLGDGRRGDVLLMSGGDHEHIRTWLPGVLARANAEQDELRFELRRLDAHLEAQPDAELPQVHGELRDSGLSTVTMGVVSSRVDVRLATAAAERALERRAEPLHALFGNTREDARFDRAWAHLVANSAHDSISGCSADAVMREVLVRAANARDIGDGIAAAALRTLGCEVAAPAGSVVVVNPTGRARGGVIEVVARADAPFHFESADGEGRATQVLDLSQEVELDATIACRNDTALLELLGPDRWAGHRIARWTEDTDGASTSVRAVIADADEPAADLGPLRARLLEFTDRHPDGTLHVTLVHPPKVRTLVHVSADGFGWRTYRRVAGGGPPTAVTADRYSIANEHLSLTADPGDGTFTIENADGLRVEGLGRIVEGGDAGDSYNWSPPTHDLLVERPTSVRVEVVERGPVRARLRITRAYEWPTAVVHTDGTTSARAPSSSPVDVVMTVDVVAGESMARLAVEFDNPVRDHRVRMLLPLPATVSSSDADGAYAVVRRPLSVRGNATEAPLPTFPAYSWVDCSDGHVGLGVAHDCVTEYEVIDGGRTVALTLLRGVGTMSRPDGRMRPAPASPIVMLPEAQLLGPCRRDFAIVLHRGDWQAAGMRARADEAFIPLETVVATGDGRTFPASGRALRVAGAEVTALYRRGDVTTLRVVRAAPTPGTLTVDRGNKSVLGSFVDLNGRRLAPFSGSALLRQWQIATLDLDDGAVGG